MVPPRLRKQLFVKALPAKYYSMVQIAETQLNDGRVDPDVYITKVAQVITRSLAHSMVHDDRGQPMAMYSNVTEQGDTSQYHEAEAYVTRAEAIEAQKPSIGNSDSFTLGLAHCISTRRPGVDSTVTGLCP